MTTTYKQIIDASITENGIANFNVFLSHIFAIPMKFRTEHPKKAATIASLFKETDVGTRNSETDKWERLMEALGDHSRTIVALAKARVEETKGTEHSFILPDRPSKLAIVYIWICELLLHLEDGTYEGKKREVLDDAEKKIASQRESKTNKSKIIQHLGWDNLTQEQKSDVLAHVENQQVSTHQMLRGARRGCSFILLPLLKRSGVSHVFTQLRKNNVWIKKPRKIRADKRKRDSDDDGSPEIPNKRRAITPQANSPISPQWPSRNNQESMMDSLILGGHYSPKPLSPIQAGSTFTSAPPQKEIQQDAVDFVASPKIVQVADQAAPFGQSITNCLEFFESDPFCEVTWNQISILSNEYTPFLTEGGYFSRE
mmetsp:Transcript_3085/g.11843  ORF Transcript_3085/g.11843 Transcript_3085/m.11843 type:complete len:371 (-) Transcript_3085:175-1287(-)